MDIFIGIIVGLIVLMFLVTAHEFGHFIMARKNGVRVLEFGICFPPRMVAWVKDPKTKKWHKIPRSEWKKPQDGLIFSLNWLPIGGFCQMDGESAADTRKGTFGNASFWAKTKILFGGVAMNWLVAFIIFTILAWTGMPEFLDNQFTIASDSKVDAKPIQITSVAEDSPASKANLKTGDYILAINDESVKYSSDVSEYNDAHAGEQVTYKIIRSQNEECIKNQDCWYGECNCNDSIELLEIPITLNPKDSEYLLGVSMSTSQALTYSTWSAPIVGAGLTLQLTGETFKGVGIMIGNLISGIASQFSFNPEVRESGQEAITAVGESISGPVGIIGVLFPTFTAAGPTNLAFLAALISVSLACMNVLPIPALDGGRWLLITIYKICKKKLTKETEEKIVSRAMFVLLALIFIVTILDIVRIAN